MSGSIDIEKFDEHLNFAIDQLDGDFDSTVDYCKQYDFSSAGNKETSNKTKMLMMKRIEEG